MSLGLIVIGAGRMGQAVVELAREDLGVSVHAVVRRRPDETALPGVLVLSDLNQAMARFAPGVVVDVAPGEGAAERIAAVYGAGWCLVEGATGYSTEAEAALKEAARRVAVVVAPNLSPGAALMKRALRDLVRAGGPAWDLGILDRHHAAKRDAPSGTARELAAAARSAGARDASIVSLRQGGIVGEHVAHLAALDEELVLTHRVLSRRVFARGALLAAQFVAGARAGRYSMEDVLGLSAAAS